jgi:site-specific recombinase XerD
MARCIAETAPTLADLNEKQLEQIAHIVMTQRLAKELNTAADFAGINYEAERNLFIENAGHTNSRHTRTGYAEALSRLKEYADRTKINVLELTPAKADDFVYSLRGRSAASIRRDVAACSSFFTFLERRHENIRNPFRGTKARPPKKTVKKIEIPTVDEVNTIIGYLPPLVSLAVSVMAFRGLRAGALPSMIIKGSRFTAYSKGKDISGELPDQTINALSGIALKNPFGSFTDNALKKRIIYYTKQMHKTGRINAPYSCHDFRHFFAVSEYRKHKDIHRLSKLLHHASIQVTETYLRSLGEIDL